MNELPPHLQAGPSASTPLPPADAPPVTAKRPFYKRKRYLLPAALLLLAMCGQDEDAVVSDRPPAAQAAAPAPTSTFDRAQWLAANDATTKDNARAVASAEAAKAAAEAAAKAKAKAEAAAKAKAEAEAAARAEAARVAAEQAAAAEAARVAAEQAAAQEAARLEAERQAAEVQQPTSVY